MTDHDFRLAERAAIRMKSERRSCSGAETGPTPTKKKRRAKR